MDKLSYEDVDVSGKRALIRVDFNVPLKDGVITNTQRIDGAVPTIRAVLERGAKVCVAKEAQPGCTYRSISTGIQAIPSPLPLSYTPVYTTHEL